MEPRLLPGGRAAEAAVRAWSPARGVEDGAAIYELKKGGAEQIVAVRVFEDDKYIWKVVK